MLVSILKLKYDYSNHLNEKGMSSANIVATSNENNEMLFEVCTTNMYLND